MNLTANEQNSVERLRKNAYPGRGIIIGMTKDSLHYVQVYWIMGRSSNSRNRIFETEGNFMRTRAFDESKVEDPSLIIYFPMRDIDGRHIVTNGDQTDTIYEYLKNGRSFEDALRTRTYEPDSPHFTPRISGMIDMQSGKPNYRLSVIKSLGTDPAVCCRQFFEYDSFLQGFGHCIHTYQKNENPLPSFSGDPLIMPLHNDIEENARFFWDFLDDENRISLAVKYIAAATGAMTIKIINKNG